jgi:hypothetical protein
MLPPSPPPLPASAVDTYNNLIGQGLTPAQASGVVGNFIQESNVNPNEPGGGIAQWIGGRWTALVAYAQSVGQPANSLTAQLGYLWTELNGPEKASLTALKATTTPAAAATSFQNNFERCRPDAPGLIGCNTPARIANANNVYSQMTGQAPPPGSTGAAGVTGTPPSSTDCAWQVNFPSIGPVGGGGVCLWQAGWSRAALGGLCIVAGGLIAVASVALIVGKEVPIPTPAGIGLNSLMNIGSKPKEPALDVSKSKYPERPANWKGKNLTTGRYMKGAL